MFEIRKRAARFKSATSTVYIVALPFYHTLRAIGGASPMTPLWDILNATYSKLSALSVLMVMMFGISGDDFSTVTHKYL
jgi:hypothetical protein